MAANPIEGLEPAGVWSAFAELSRIPRESKHEQVAAAFVMREARTLGREYRQDPVGNVVVRKPASAGRERAPSVCLQGHLDMVCVARPGKVHDFARDPIVLQREGDWITADGTTLGADNGIAVAACLAIMRDRGLEHGPLELLFTVDEETGLSGAREIAPDLLASRTLLNLDSEDEGVLTVGCAGGRDTTGVFELAWDPTPAGMVAFDLRVTGLKGGHSGVEIHQGRGNAIKLLNRALTGLAPLGGRVATMSGGSKRNAIPAEAVATVCVPRARAGEAQAAVGELRDTAKAELARIEPGLDLCATPRARRPARVFKRALQRRITHTLAGLPHGVIRMSPDIAGLVETSTNIAVLSTSRHSLSIATSQRSSVASQIHEIIDTVSAILELGGATVQGRDPYPGWTPNLDSPVLATVVRTYRELYGREPKIEAIHAGLECGILGEKYPGMDMVSLGPTLKEVHSPDERIEISSVARFWDYLLAILRTF